MRGFGLLVICMTALFMIGLFQGRFFDRTRTYIAGGFESYFLSAGIKLKKIVITGQVTLRDEQIISALGIRTGQSLFGYDVNDAQIKLAKLGQVRSVRIMRLLPSTLLVEIKERVPFARWLHDGKMHLIDKDGTVLRDITGEKHASYPLVTGEKAGDRVAQLIRVLSSHKALAGRIKMAEWVGQYRWTLHAKSGARIKLPAGHLGLGLARFVELPDWSALLEQKNLVVDLRQPAQVYVNKAQSASFLVISGS